MDDVDQFPCYIACDSETRSEIFVPIIRSHITAVLGIDAGEKAAFDKVDKTEIEKVIKQFV